MCLVEPWEQEGTPTDSGEAEVLETDQNQGRRSKACSRLEAEGPGLAGVVTALGIHGDNEALGSPRRFLNRAVTQ